MNICGTNPSTVKPSGGAGRFEPAADERLDCLREEGVVGPVGGDGAQPADRHIVDDEHDRREDRQGQPAVGDHLVDPVRRGHAGVLFMYAVFHQPGDVPVTLIGDDALAVVVELLFTVGDDRL